MSCNICFSDNPKNPITTPCNHTFCYNCIKEWVNIKQNCPCCRRDFNFEQLLEYYQKYSDEIVTRSKTLSLRREIILKKTKENLQELSNEISFETRIIKAYNALKFVYKNKEAFNSFAERGLFLKTVLNKAIEFYNYNDVRCKIFYEWIFKFREYISIIDKKFNINSYVDSINYFTGNTFVV